MQPIDAFIVGVPKAGTTWLANTMSQHPQIQISDPKEPNIVSSHKGTFDRILMEPNWLDYENYFTKNGLRIDASVHTFACPLSPKRIFNKIPDMKFILCLREPISRTISHWNMVRDTKSDIENNVDWSDFSIAWSDDRLKSSSLYGQCMERWLEYFSIDNFLIIDSNHMRNEPNKILSQVENFLNLNSHNYIINLQKHANSASDRRPLTKLCKLFRRAFSNIPKTIKTPIVNKLQSIDLNIYSMPIISGKPKIRKVNKNYYKICSSIVINDLKKFEKLTNYSTAHWITEINQYSSDSNQIS